MEKEILISARIIETVENLVLRIEDRFPGSGLHGVARRLSGIARETDKTIEWIKKPSYMYRGIAAFFILLILGGLVLAIMHTKVESDITQLSNLVALSEAALNDVVLIGATIIFLMTLETRAKRSKVVKAISRLRSIAHIIDAHQLTKDPNAIAQTTHNTEHSPKRNLTRYELGRYLDYCSEMLSLTSKVGFLYIQHFDDPVSVNAVNDLENLTTGLSRKVWQKIMILRQEA